jgi:CPA1 family monovalent cation:H+ antiporter
MQEQEFIIQKKIAKASLQYLQEKYVNELGQNKHLGNLFARLQIDLDFFEHKTQTPVNTNGNELSGYHRIYLDLLNQQRTWLNDMNGRTEFDEELIRKYLSFTDIEELKTREKLSYKIQAK